MQTNKALKPFLSNESITFQRDDFPMVLESIVEEMRTVVYEYPDNIAVSRLKPIFKKLEAAILERFNMKVTVQGDNQDFGVIVLGMLNTNHVGLKSWVRGRIDISSQRRAVQQFAARPGYVDRRKAKLAGIFTEYSHLMLIPPITMFKIYGFTNREVAGSIVHEIGHVFNFYEHSNRFDETNRVLQGIADKIKSQTDKNFDPGKYEYILYQAVKGGHLDQKDVDKMLRSRSRFIFNTRLFDAYIGKVGSQLTDSTYNRTSEEQNADQFAAMFGYGTAIATAVDKLRGKDDVSKKKFGFVELSLPDTKFVNEFGLFTAILFGTMATSLIATFVGYGIGIILSTLFLAMSASGENELFYTYDDLKIRYKRLREQNIEILKSKDLPKEVINKLVEDISTIDDLMGNTYVHRGLLAYIKTVSSKEGREAKRSILRQQLMETLANNNLFLHSALLRSHTQEDSK